MELIPAEQRPHYLPTERLFILELRAARGWSQAQTADHMLVTPATIASWMRRIDEEGPAARIQMREPVNPFPDFVGHVVRSLKTRCPTIRTQLNQWCKQPIFRGSLSVDHYTGQRLLRALQEAERPDSRDLLFSRSSR